MRHLSLVGVVLCLFAFSAEADPRTRNRNTQRFDRWFPADFGVGSGAAPAPPPFFSFAPADGQGMDSPESLCAQLAPGEKVGDWTCMKGDGTFEGTVLTKAGTDLDSSSYVCGGGDVVMASRNPNSSAVWTAASARVGGANYTTCAFVKPSPLVGEQAMLTWSSSGSGANLGLSPWLGATGTTYNLYYSFGSPCANATAVTHPTALVPNAAHVLCTRISSSGAVVDLFVNGAKHNSTSVGVNVGCDDGSTQKYNVNSWAGAVPQANGSSILGAFATETALSDARIQAISAAALGVSPASVSGAPVVFTRNAPATATKGTNSLRTTGIANGDMVMCAVNQPRVVKGASGILRGLREPAASNVCLYSEDFLNGSGWALSAGGSPTPAVPTRTANAAVAPNGMLTADRIDYPAVSGTGYSVVYAAPRLSTALWVVNFFCIGINLLS